MTMSASTRVNLSIPLEMGIQIEKDCEKRGIGKTQFIKESIYEKLKKTESSIEDELKLVSEDVGELKKIMRLILDALNKN